jgi:cytoplasmic tRNA 2-thiolation protein 2
MKDMLSKEIGIYNQFTGLDDVCIQSVTSMMHAKASIERLAEGKFCTIMDRYRDRLTKFNITLCQECFLSTKNIFSSNIFLADFIVGLEKEFPSTVSTIARTGAKLTPSDSIMKENRCVVCLMYVIWSFLRIFFFEIFFFNLHILYRPYQENNKIWQNRIIVMTIPSSQQSNGCSLDCSRNTTPGDCINGCNDTSNDESMANVEFADSLCYACRVNIRDIKLTNKKIILPPYIAEGVEERKKEINRKQMRKHIEEYLLCSEEEL